MKFNDTGLPMDAEVLNAFSMYEQNAQAALPAGAAAEMADEMPVRSAQVLNETGAATSMITLALLSGLPPETWGVVKRRFGDETVQNLEEAYRHQRTNFAYIEEAPQAVQQLLLASSVVTFTVLGDLADKAISAIDGIQAGFPPAEGLALPMMPDVRPFQQFGEKTDNKSGNDALELRFAQELDTYRNKGDLLAMRAQEIGIPMPPPSGLPGAASPALRYPLFDETEILDDPKVRAVYDVVINHGNVAPENFEAAISVAKLLTDKVPGVSATTVAAGLLDVALPGMGPDDFTFLDKKVDGDVLDLVKDNTVYNIQSPVQLLKSPVPFRQIAFANAIAVLDDAQKGAAELFDAAKTQNLPPQIVAANLRPLLMVALVSERVIGPAAGTIDAPALEQAFVDKLKEFKTFLKENAPKPQQAQNGEKHIASFERDDEPHNAPEKAQPKKRIASFDNDDGATSDFQKAAPKKRIASFDSDPEQDNKPDDKKGPDASARKPKKGASFDL